MEKSLNEKLNEINKLLENYDFRKTAKFCFVPSCPTPPINSHTIQKKKILAYLEDKTDKNYIKVYSLEDKPSVSFTDKKLLTFHSHRRKLVELAKDEASTISGFCGDHDKTIFKAIEDEQYENIPLKNFLHSFRAYVYDINCTKGLYNIFFDFLKQGSSLDGHLKELNDTISLIKNIIFALPDNYVCSESDIAFQRLLQTNSILKALNLSSDLDKIDLKNKTGKELKEYFAKSILQLKRIPQLNPYFIELNNIVKNQGAYLDLVSNDLLEMYHKDNFNSFNFFTHRFKGLYPIACCFVANISNQNSLKPNEHTKYQPKYTLVIFPDVSQKETIVIFSSMEFNHSKLFYSRINILPNKELEFFLTNIILAKGTNCFISPRLWNKFSESERELMLKDKSNSDPMYIDTQNKGLNLFEEKFRE